MFESIEAISRCVSLSVRRCVVFAVNSVSLGVAAFYCCYFFLFYYYSLSCVLLLFSFLLRSYCFIVCFLCVVSLCRVHCLQFVHWIRCIRTSSVCRSKCEVNIRKTRCENKTIHNNFTKKIQIGFYFQFDKECVQFGTVCCGIRRKKLFFFSGEIIKR